LLLGFYDTSSVSLWLVPFYLVLLLPGKLVGHHAKDGEHNQEDGRQIH
jgi:hypothetical protein